MYHHFFRKSNITICLLSLTLILAFFHLVSAQDDTLTGNEFPYEFFDTAGVVDLGNIAELDLPDGYFFTGEDGAKAVMEAYGNPVTGKEKGYVEPDSANWFVLFEFDNIGYVKDDEKDELNADALLKSFIEGTKASNKERKEKGWPTLTITGWYQEPFYNTETHNLEWAIQGIDSDSSLFLNYNVRLLGRRGVMEATLVIAPEELDAELPTFKEFLTHFRYKPGNTYAEFQEGDKLYEYGLTALIGGGVAAVAAKTGVFKWLWKVLLAAGAAIAGAIKKLFGKKKKNMTNV